MRRVVFRNLVAAILESLTYFRHGAKELLEAFKHRETAIKMLSNKTSANTEPIHREGMEVSILLNAYWRVRPRLFSVGPLAGPGGFPFPYLVGVAVLLGDVALVHPSPTPRPRLRLVSSAWLEGWNRAAMKMLSELKEEVDERLSTDRTHCHSPFVGGARSAQDGKGNQGGFKVQADNAGTAVSRIGDGQSRPQGHPERVGVR
jgi:hypothetical protein